MLNLDIIRPKNITIGHLTGEISEFQKIGPLTPANIALTFHRANHGKLGLHGNFFSRAVTSRAPT